MPHPFPRPFSRAFARILCLFAALLALAQPLAAKCTGRNLIAALPADQTARLDAEVARHPYATGNFWRATRGDAVLHIIGTYHIDDRRHTALMATLEPLILSATTVLVEAGPEEEAALKRAMATDPNLMFLKDGPSLLEQLGPDDWAALAAAMDARGIPAFMAAKFKPWYVSLLLGMPPCAMADITAANGLDHRVIDLATSKSIPVQPLEPHETLLRLFDKLTPDEQLGMIRSTLLLEDRAADLSTTLADSYFAQDSRRVWEYMRIESHNMPGFTAEIADAEYARMEELLMKARNRAWIPVIEAATAKGPVFAAFGALHLSGDEGVLNLLQQAGFTLERLPL